MNARKHLERAAVQAQRRGEDWAAEIDADDQERGLLVNLVGEALDQLPDLEASER